MVTPVLPLHSVDSALETRSSPPSSLRFRDRVRLRLGEQDLIVVRVGVERFALPVDAVDELIESPRLRPVPGASAALLGVFSLGDRLLSLFDPAALLGASLHGEPVALVMRTGARVLALAVDDADDVVRVDLAEVRDAPRIDREDELVLGVLWQAPDLITVLDPRAVGQACITAGGLE